MWVAFLLRRDRDSLYIEADFLFLDDAVSLSAEEYSTTSPRLSCRLTSLENAFPRNGI